MIFALDNNIISFAINDRFNLRQLIMQKLESGIELIVPPISLYETRRGLYRNNAGNKLDIFNKKFVPLVKGTMRTSDWELAATIYNILVGLNQNPEDDDIFQAAYCINRGYTLVTDNTKHFENIPGLHYENWVNRKIK
jgi:predicted nucleic acid-binding protein